jgi:hypothetical protein
LSVHRLPPIELAEFAKSAFFFFVPNPLRQGHFLIQWIEKEQPIVRRTIRANNGRLVTEKLVITVV